MRIPFEIPVLRNCHNTIIDVGLTRGEFDLFIGGNGNTDAIINRPILLSDAVGNDNIVICADDLDASGLYGGENDFTPYLFRGGLPLDSVHRIRGVLIGTGECKLTVTGAALSNFLHLVG